MDLRRARGAARTVVGMTRPDLRLVPPVDYDTRPDLLEALARKERRLRIYEPALIDRIIDATGSERFLFAYLGFVCGCLTTVLAAFCWARFGL